MGTSRSAFLLSVAGAAVAMPPDVASAANAAAPMTARDALKALIEGNQRFASGKPRCATATARLVELASGQSPFATVLGCSDSRVPVETVFDREPGDIFVVRIAGNFLTTEGLGSIEYATSVLKTPLVMVLGHASCGAVQAAIEFVKTGKPFPSQIQSLAAGIAQAAERARHEPGDWLANAVKANVQANVEKLKATPLMSDAIAHHRVEVVGAVYELKTGRAALV